MVQRRAAWFVTGNYEWYACVSDILQHLQWDNLEMRHTKFWAIAMHKIHNNLVDINPGKFLQPTSTMTRGHPLNFKHLQAHVKAFKHSFYPSTIKIWNSLPNEVALFSMFEQFKENPNL